MSALDFCMHTAKNIVLCVATLGCKYIAYTFIRIAFILI